MGDQNLPFGLRDTRLRAFTDAAATTLAASGVDFPVARSLSFEEAEDYEELRGDDKVVAIRGKGASVDWEMENGGISLGAYKTMAGGTITVTGVSPATVTSFRKLSTDARPYFKAEGQSMNDNGGDFHIVLHKCRASEGLEGELAEGAFWLTGSSGTALPSTVSTTTDALYDLISNETVTAIT